MKRDLECEQFLSGGVHLGLQLFAMYFSFMWAQRATTRSEVNTCYRLRSKKRGPLHQACTEYLPWCIPYLSFGHVVVFFASIECFCNLPLDFLQQH